MTRMTCGVYMEFTVDVSPRMVSALRECTMRSSCAFPPNHSAMNRWWTLARDAICRIEISSGLWRRTSSNAALMRSSMPSSRVRRGRRVVAGFLAAAFLVGVFFVEVATRILTLVGAATRYLCVGLRRLLRLPQFRRATNDCQWLRPQAW